MAFSKETNKIIAKIKKIKIINNKELENERTIILSKLKEISKIEISEDFDKSIQEELNVFFNKIKNKTSIIKKLKKIYNNISTDVGCFLVGLLLYGIILMFTIISNKIKNFIQVFL